MGGREDRETYRTQIAAIARVLGKEGGVKTANFDSLADLAEQMSKLQTETRPFTMKVKG
jgi:hypothetical protein